MNTLALDALAHLAWADTVLHDREREFLVTCLDASGIPAEGRDRWLGSPPALPSGPELAAALPDEKLKRDFLRLVLRLANVDEDLDPAEWKVLHALCEQLSVPAKDWGDLRRWLDV